MTIGSWLTKKKLLLVAVQALGLLALPSSSSREIHGEAGPRALPMAGGQVKALVRAQGLHPMIFDRPAPHRTLSCVPPPPPPLEALEKADVAFLGTVSAVDANLLLGALRARFRVHRSWKGEVWPGIQVDTPLLSTGIFFEIGSRLVVFADVGSGRLFTETCDGTTSDVEAAIRQLPPSEAVFDHYLPGLVVGGMMAHHPSRESHARPLSASGAR
jgi:hypothetical protein